MNRSPVAPPRLLAWCITVLAGSACSIPQATLGRMNASRLGDFDSYRVAYLVQCRGCQVFATGGEAVEEVDGQWTETVRVDSGTVPMVTLTATPTSSTGYVARAYIEVEGTIVAEARRSPADAIGEVSLTAVLTSDGASGRPGRAAGWGN